MESARLSAEKRDYQSPVSIVICLSLTWAITELCSVVLCCGKSINYECRFDLSICVVLMAKGKVSVTDGSGRRSYNTTHNIAKQNNFSPLQKKKKERNVIICVVYSYSCLIELAPSHYHNYSKARSQSRAQRNVAHGRPDGLLQMHV